MIDALHPVFGALVGVLLGYLLFCHDWRRKPEPPYFPPIANTTMPTGLYVAEEKT